MKSLRGQDASPQVGKGSRGHTEVSHEIMEALYSFPLPGVQLRILLFILRDSYGWKRKETMAYSFPQIALIVAADRTGVFKAFAELKKKGILESGPNGGWVFVKNYNAWGNTPELPLERPLKEINGGQESTQVRGQESTESVIPVNIALIPVNAYRRKKKEINKEGAQRAPGIDIFKNETDTPRLRAEHGDPERPPEEHPFFTRLGYKRREELTDLWKEARKKHLCRKGCGRPKASATWPYCSPCTVCEACGKGVVKGETRKFFIKNQALTCGDCQTGGGDGEQA